MYYVFITFYWVWEDDVLQAALAKRSCVFENYMPLRGHLRPVAAEALGGFCLHVTTGDVQCPEQMLPLHACAFSLLCGLRV
jgi:hypothetical protein